MGRASARWLLALLLGLTLGLLPAPPTSAQSQGLVVRDGSLGSGPLEVGPGTDPLGGSATYLITPELGEQSGRNLFHSFRSFGIGTGETATFTGPGGIDHVISRVTGGGESRIDGTLRSTLPDADVWLLNPSGVVFGAGAQLDVPGSFHASTGDYVGFEGSLERFYGDPSRPSVLSTAAPAAFGFLGESGAAAISLEPGASLGVDPGRGLELVAGEVSLTDAEIVAPGAHLSLEARATVGLSRSTLDVSGGAPGSVSIRGGRLVMKGGPVAGEERSLVLAENQGSGPGGSISIETSESVHVDNGLLSVNTSSEGDAGKIHVASSSVTFEHGMAWNVPVQTPTTTDVGASAETVSSGAAGEIRIGAHELLVRDGAEVSAMAVGSEERVARGKGGTVEIVAHRVEVSERAAIVATAWGSLTEAGTIKIELVDDGSLLVDAKAQAHGPGSYADLDTSANGTPGRIEIEGGKVELRDGGGISSQCYKTCTSTVDDRPEGAGTIRIDVDSLTLSEGGFIAASTNASGDAGSIEIDADSMTLSEGGSIYAYSEGSGNAGKVKIDAESVTLSEGGFIYAGTSGSGNGGQITIDADSVRIGSSDPEIASGIVVNTGGTGHAGVVDIEARSLVIGRGGIVLANSEPGPGDAGIITVRSDTVRIGPDPEAPPPGADTHLQPAFVTASSITPLGSELASGKAGEIDVRATKSILLTDAGDRSLSAAEVLLRMAGGHPSPVSGIFSVTVEGGDGGSIRLEAPEITVTHGAQVSSATLGGAAGGRVELNVDRLVVANGGDVGASSLPHPITQRRSGDAGDVTVDAAESIEIIGTHPHPDAAQRPSRISSASVGSGRAATLTLRAPRILLDGGAVATSAVPSFLQLEGIAGGDITLDTEQLIVRGGGRIDASTFIPGPGGRIEIGASQSILVEGAGSGIASRTGGSGTGGGVTLRAPRIEVSQGGELAAKSEAGFNELKGIFVDTGLFGNVPPVADGNAGSVTLAASKLLLTGGTIATNAEVADGGSVTIEAKDLVHLDAGVITAAVRDGAGGNITIDPEVVILEHGSRIVADAGAGSGGNIQISADNYFAFPGTVVDASSDLGIDGIVEVHTPDVDLAGTLTALPASYLDASSLMRERCAARRSGERAGSFAVRGNGGIPAEPDGWLPARVSFEGAPGPAPTTERPSPSSSAPRLAQLGTCQ